MFGLIRLSMALCVLFPSCMAFYGIVTHFMVFYGSMSSFLAVIEPNSFGLVLVYFFLSVLIYNKLVLVKIEELGKFTTSFHR